MPFSSAAPSFQDMPESPVRPPRLLASRLLLPLWQVLDIDGVRSQQAHHLEEEGNRESASIDARHQRLVAFASTQVLGQPLVAHALQFHLRLQQSRGGFLPNGLASLVRPRFQDWQ